MRLWHKGLLKYLPRLQLISQWRECCCIAKGIVEKGTPNHILVNKITNYPIDHFMTYCDLVAKEMYNRGYKCDSTRLTKWTKQLVDEYTLVSDDNLFSGWHNDIYLRQSLYNLEEKAMCHGITANEWQVIHNRFKDFTPLWDGN